MVRRKGQRLRPKGLKSEAGRPERGAVLGEGMTFDIGHDDAQEGHATKTELQMYPLGYLPQYFTFVVFRDTGMTVFRLN